MALDKIKKPKSKKILKVSLLVVRITPSSTPDSYTLINSRPCIACMHKIKNSAEHGIKINKIYFSNELGEVICYKLRDILNEKQHISKYYRMTVIPKEYTRNFEISNPDKIRNRGKSNIK
ncbi:cytidine deaminase [Cotonvirus japonicus]|uniref:Cytidine deaminase n=1 Tax=Cotonvirus japonicus TaxID=2811091 RepID=A0ABM7NS04_9VIRU|nr:cytidine deaminase [Cotonvirus japonicus]BCS82940.1 cytidine deaminase [Cotonvirus japonicus]